MCSDCDMSDMADMQDILDMEDRSDMTLYQLINFLGGEIICQIIQAKRSIALIQKN